MGKAEPSPTRSGWALEGCCSFNSSTIHPSLMDHAQWCKTEVPRISLIGFLVLFWGCGLFLNHSIDSITEVMPKLSRNNMPGLPVKSAIGTFLQTQPYVGSQGTLRPSTFSSAGACVMGMWVMCLGTIPGAMYRHPSPVQQYIWLISGKVEL